MIFTDRFVYVHEPKTGGTFVTSMLFRLYGLRWTRWTHMRNAVLGEVQGTHPHYGALVHNSNKHGGCNEIPPSQRGKKILATVRNPFDLYVSQYEFGWWKRSEFRKYYEAVPNFRRDYPNFPDLDFAGYVRLSNEAFRSLANGHASDVGPGLITEQFLKFYFIDPGAAYAKLSRGAYAANGAHLADMHDLHFIRTDDLNRGLFDFLARNDYAHEDISFILAEGKILPRGKGRETHQKWEQYYTPELKEIVRRKEEFLFKLFPEFDV
ncbi:MAG TPA: hypothetical protein VFI24_28725 [Pyrinomonadaceae bacterium]|nr:hypothetical protein [Pyrinomonadaceae bacterium]